MIKLDLQPLPKESEDKLRSWLERPEFELLKVCVLARIHEQSAKATNLSLNRPITNISETGLPQGAVKALSEAAEWKIALDKLNEISSPGTELNTITSTSYLHASHD